MTWKRMTENLGVMFLRWREGLDRLTRGGVSLNKNKDDLPTVKEGMQTRAHSASGQVGRVSGESQWNFLLNVSIFPNKIESNCLASSPLKCSPQNSN